MKKIIGDMEWSKYKKYFNIKFFFPGFVMVVFYNVVIKGCSDAGTTQEDQVEDFQKDNYKFGYNLNNYHVVNDTVRSGDSFGGLLEKHQLFYPKIHHSAEKIGRAHV